MRVDHRPISLLIVVGICFLGWVVFLVEINARDRSEQLEVAHIEARPGCSPKTETIW